MTKKLSIAALSLAAIVGLAAPALAQTSTTTTTTVAPSADVNFGEVVSAIQADKMNAQDLAAVSDASKVKIVNIADLAKGENEKALTNALDKNKEDVTALQAAVAANTTIKTELEKQNFSNSNVVAANTSADGTVTIYVK